MIPPFCGLAPAMADQLVAAFEEHERKCHAKELEEAENERKMRQAQEGIVFEDTNPRIDLLKNVSIYFHAKIATRLGAENINFQDASIINFFLLLI